jgi:nucleotide-binding universal stress UspA family protein
VKILIAYDGSACADAAVKDLRRAGLPEAVEARVLTIAEVLLPVFSKAPDADEPERAGESRRLQAVRDAYDLANAAAQNVAAMFPKWTVTAHGRPDSPAWGVIKEADSWHPDLVVLGSEGRSGLSRLLVGSVSHKVLTQGNCTLRVARGRDVPVGSPIRVIVGVDGSRGSDLALQAVAARHWPRGTEVLLLAVTDAGMSTGLLSGPMAGEMVVLADQADQTARVRAALERSEAILRAKGLSIRSALDEGDPKRVLIQRAKDWPADSVFLGARGLSGVERFLLGSVSATVAMHAPCSVEVIHGPEPSAGAGRRS